MPAQKKKDEKAESTEEEELEGDETETETETDEDPLPQTLEELQTEVKDLRVQLRRVTKESVKRKKKIREMEAGSKTDTSSDDELAALKKQNDTLESENKRLAAGNRSNKIADLVSDYVAAQKIKIASPRALKDLARFVEEQIPADAVDEDFADEIAALVPQQIKSRTYLVEQKRAPDIDQSRQGDGKEISSDVVADVGRAFGLSTE